MFVAGDIDGCGAGKETADLIEDTAAPVLTLGDNAYPSGTTSDYEKCYAPTWGEFKSRTHPIPGNHDYDASRATPYYQYFGAAAGDPGTGWYSYNVGTWHVVALNSNCSDVDCKKQVAWLDADLTANPSACILAAWHHPRFSSGTSGGDSAMGEFWKVLYAHNATLVFNGHDHDYERFAPMDPSGRLDRARGIREFIVGTGGATLGSLANAASNSEVRNNDSFGVLRLTLRPDGYDWRFLPIAGDKLSDSGSDSCRGTVPTTTTVAPAAPPAPPAGEQEADQGPPPSWEDPGPQEPVTTTPPPSVTTRPRTAPTTAPGRQPSGGKGPSGGRAPSTTATRAPSKHATNEPGPAATISTAPPAGPDQGFLSPIADIPALPVGEGPPRDADAPAADDQPISSGGVADPPAANPSGDDDELSMAIAGLIEDPPTHDGPAGRTGPVLLALVLLVVDVVAIQRVGLRRIIDRLAPRR